MQFDGYNFWIKILKLDINLVYFDKKSIMNKHDKPTKSHLNELQSYHYRCDLNIDPGKNNIVSFTIYN